MGTDRHLITSEDQIFEILASSAYLIVNKQLLRKLGPEPAVMLSNLIDKYKYFRENEQLLDVNYFYLLHEDQMDQTGLTRYKIQACKKVLKEHDMIETRRVGNNEWYKLNAINIIQYIGINQTSENPTSENPTSENPMSDIRKPDALLKKGEQKGEQKKEIYKESNFDSGRFLEMFPEDWQADAVFKDALERFVQHRRELRRPLTKPSSTMARNKLVGNHPDSKEDIEYDIDLATLSFNAAIEKGYITVFPESAARYPHTGSTAKTTRTPEQIFGEKFSGTYATQFNTYFVAAQRLLTETSNGESVRLAENMVHLRLYVKQHQTEKAQKNMDIPNPGLLVHQYTNWLEQQDWVDAVLPATYLPNSKLFEKFIAHTSSQLRVNVLNGEPKYSVVE